MKRVSFDFDSTLDREDVQLFCADLIKKGFQCWIVTSRFSDEELEKKWSMRFPDANKTVFEVASNLGITNIKFTNMKNKSEFFEENQDFIFHLDDDDLEIRFINEDTKVKGILCMSNDWLNECKELIN